MATKKPSTTPEMVQFLLTKSNWSQHRIIKEFRISSKTLSKIANGKFEKKKSGPKFKFLEQHKAYVVEIACLNPRLSAKVISQRFNDHFPHLTISDQKVREIIKENDYRYLSYRKIQLLNEVQITIRYNFSFSLLEDFDEDGQRLQVN